MNKYIFTAGSFGESVKKWSYKQFMARFKPIFPDADLETLADELGIKKPVAMFDKPKRGGLTPPPTSKTKAHDQDTTGGEKDRKDKRKGAGQGEHEANEERLH